MPDILRVATPVVTQGVAPKPTPQAPLDPNLQNVVDLSRVTKTDSQNVYPDRRPQTNLPNYESNYGNFINTLQNMPDVNDLYTQIFFMRSGLVVNSGIDESFTKEISQYMDMLKMTEKELLSFLKYQAQTSTKFAGPVFDVLRNIFASSSSIDVKTAILDMLRKYTSMSSSNHTLNEIISNLKNIMRQMPASSGSTTFPQALAALIAKLAPSETGGTPVSLTNTPLPNTDKANIAPGQAAAGQTAASQAAASQPPTFTMDTLQLPNGVQITADGQVLASDNPSAPIIRLPNGVQIAADGQIDTSNVHTDNAVQLPNGVKIMANGNVVPHVPEPTAPNAPNVSAAQLENVRLPNGVQITANGGIIPSAQPNAPATQLPNGVQIAANGEIILTNVNSTDVIQLNNGVRITPGGEIIPNPQAAASNPAPSSNVPQAAVPDSAAASNAPQAAVPDSTGGNAPQAADNVQLPNGVQITANGGIIPSTQPNAPATQLPNGVQIAANGEVILSNVHSADTIQLSNGVKITSGGELIPNAQINTAQSSAMPNTAQSAAMPNAAQSSAMPNTAQSAPSNIPPITLGSALPTDNVHLPNGVQITPSGEIIPSAQPAESSIIQFPNGVQLTPNGQFILSQVSSTDIIQLPNGVQITHDGQVIPVSAQQTQEALARSNDQMYQNLNVLKNEVIPLLSEYIGRTNDFGAVRDMITIFTLNLARYEQGSPESFNNSFRNAMSFNEIESKFSSFGIKNLENLFIFDKFYDIMADVGRNMPDKAPELIDKLISIITKGLHSASPQAKPIFENIVQAMLINESIYMPLVHVMIPANVYGHMFFSEMWIDPDANNTGGSENERAVKILVKFDIKNIGFFELIILSQNKNVDMNVFYPPKYAPIESTIKRGLNEVMSRNGLNVRSLMLDRMQEPKSVSEVFPKIFERKNAINVII